VRSQWQWSYATSLEQSARATEAASELAVDAVLQVGTQVNIEHPTAIRACITDATVIQSVRAGEASVSQSSRVAEAMAWQGAVFRSMDVIFTLSEWAARSVIEDYGIAPERVVVSGAGANLEAPPPRRTEHPMILFVGWDWERKGGPAILDAFRVARQSIPDLELAIVGCTPVADEPGVTVIGPLDRRDPDAYAQLQALYGRATMFALCSRFDAFPNVLLEAQWSGVPVVAYDEASRPEAVIDGTTGFLVPRTEPMELAAAIHALASNPERAAAMGAAAHDHVASRFTWPIVADRILTTLDAIRDARRTRSSAVA